jgi:phosphohistidine phosphatase
VILYLVRHGEAKVDADDTARPLTDRGREVVERLGQAAAARSVVVAEIRHSGLLRARQTAEILAAHLRPGGGVRATTGLGPDDDPDIARAECQLAGEPLVLVGHLPHLARLESGLTGRRTELSLQPGTMLALARSAGGWELTWRIN